MNEYNNLLRENIIFFSKVCNNLTVPEGNTQPDNQSMFYWQGAFMDTETEKKLLA